MARATSPTRHSRTGGRAYDAAVIGAGIAGSAFAITMQRAGWRVALIERTNAYRDRIRGDGLAPWGVAEASRLDLADVLIRHAGARELPYWDTWESGARTRRDVLASSDPHGLGVLAFRHHEAQAALLERAEAAGVHLVLLRELARSIPVAAEGAELHGLVGAFPNASRWLAPLHASGVVLIGDAAGAVDPSIGQGLAASLRDVRELRDALSGAPSIEEALCRYAARRAHYFAVQRLVALASWRCDEPTPSGEEARDRLASNGAAREGVMRAIREDPLSVPPSIQTARALLGVVGDDESTEAAAELLGVKAPRRQGAQPPQPSQPSRPVRDRHTV